MRATRLTPILNVSDIQQSFDWFERLGWQKAWEWGTPAHFGGVCSGACEIFLCENAQGGRGRSTFARTFGPDGNDAADTGSWMSIWVDDVDAIHQRCQEHGLDVTWPPTDMPWHVREMHVRHPDGHVLRISRGLEAAANPETATDQAGDAPAETADAVAVILDLEQRLARAWIDGDRAFIEAVLAPDWRVTDPSGRILTRQQVLDETFASTDRQIDAMVVDEVTVHTYGTMAVATGRTRASGHYQGQESAVTLRFTDVFHVREGRWQVVASHGTLSDG